MKAFLCIVTFENDDEAQRNGAVDIIWGMDYLRADTDVDSKSTKEAQEQPRWLPLRINAIHLCNDMDPIKHFFARFTIALSGPELRTRFRMHGGTCVSYGRSHDPTKHFGNMSLFLFLYVQVPQQRSCLH